MENQLLPWSRNSLPMEIAAEGMEILKRGADRGGVAELRPYLRGSSSSFRHNRCGGSVSGSPKKTPAGN
jgi:hypothetical protein